MASVRPIYIVCDSMELTSCDRDVLQAARTPPTSTCSRSARLNPATVEVATCCRYQGPRTNNPVPRRCHSQYGVLHCCYCTLPADVSGYAALASRRAVQSFAYPSYAYGVQRHSTCRRRCDGSHSATEMLKLKRWFDYASHLH